jgi:ATP-binding cassette subfamily A (ABC1) protein 5
VAIMISGKLVCLGTTQHLKSKYGEGYVLEVKLNPGQAYYTLDHNSAEARQLLDDLLARLRAKVLQIFPSAEVSETFGERVIYRIPREGALQLSAIFAELEQGKETLNIEEYSFSQATLEQVFIEFAKAQRDDDGSEDRSASPKHASTDMV